MGWSHRQCAEELTVLRKFSCSLCFFTLLFATLSPLQAQPKVLPVPLKDQPGVHSRSFNLVQDGGAPVSLEIVSACLGGVATFKVINVGERWPGMGILKVYQIVDGQNKPVSEREMRFAQGQKASFRMKNPGGGSLGLFVEPSWYKRQFEFDAVVKCE